MDDRDAYTAIERLSGQQRALFGALAEKEHRLATIYRGALGVLADAKNPDRFALTAHGIRELMEKLPVYLDLPVKQNPPSLGMKVREFAECWDRLKYVSSRESNSDDVDRFLRKSDEFFEWFESDRPSRRQSVQTMLRGLDPGGSTLPEPIENLQIAAWQKCDSFFQSVSHHRKSCKEEDFRRWLGVLEAFLLDRLRPRTFADQDEILSIIKEGEENA